MFTEFPFSFGLFTRQRLIASLIHHNKKVINYPCAYVKRGELIHVNILFAHYLSGHAFGSKAQQSLTIAARTSPFVFAFIAACLEFQLHSFGESDGNQRCLQIIIHVAPVSRLAMGKSKLNFSLTFHSCMCY